jgi:hypothetical protein
LNAPDAQKGGGKVTATRIPLKRLYVLIAFLPIPLVFAPTSLAVIPNGVYHVVPLESPVQTVLVGKNWQYTVGFRVENVAAIQKLIQCESQGVNVSERDSDGIVSDGILQFHRSSKGASLGSGTWAWMEKLSGIEGSPIQPSDAIRMTDWAISHGLIGQWSCAPIMHLL